MLIAKRVFNILQKPYFREKYIQENYGKISRQSDKNCKNNVARKFEKLYFEKNRRKVFVTDFLCMV